MMLITYTNKEIKEMGGRKAALEDVERMEQAGLDPKSARSTKRHIIEKTKQPRKPREKLKTELLKVRMTKVEIEKVQAFAEEKGITVSQLIREYVRRLPNPESKS